MSNMAEVNGTDHLVRHEKETKLNGYDNEGFHSHERTGEDEESSGSDDDRLRTVVVTTENGHRPEDDSTPLSNGRTVHGHDESNNGYTTTTVNGSAVIVVEETGCKQAAESNSSSGSSNVMNDSKDCGSSCLQKPLDTRLHHFVPVDDIDRKILNNGCGGSDSKSTRVTIPEDAVISFTTGRVKVKKSNSSQQNQALSNSDRESIPLETMLPSYEAAEGLGEKAELEAELAANNHKNGLWSEGHNKAYNNSSSNPSDAPPFGNSEKLNGTSKSSSDEIGLPVNNHRKCLSSDVSDTSSEHKSTGEKLYFTDESRKVCPGWRRIIVCGLILIIIAVAIMLGAFAATGILLSKSESKNTKYESGHSLPSIDSISHAGHSFRPRPSSSKVPQKFLPPVTEDADLPPNSTMAGVEDTVSRPTPPTVTSKVPLLNDSSHSQTIVPNALVGEFTIDENFTEDLKDSTSEGYRSLAKYIERELHGLFKRSGGVFEYLKILSFSPGSIKIKFVTIWTSDQNVILSQKAVEIMKSYLKKNRNSLLAYPVNVDSIHFIDVFDECKVQKGGCSFECVWDYNTLSKTCICEGNMELLADGKSCGPKILTSNLETTTPKLVYTLPPTTITSVTELPLLTEEYPGTTLDPSRNIQTTTQIPDFITKTIVTLSELFTDLTTTENTTSVHEIASLNIPNATALSGFTTKILETTTEPVTEESTTLLHVFSNNSLETVDGTTTAMPTITDDQASESIDSTTSEGFDAIGNFSNATNLSLDTTTPAFELETTTEKPTSNSPTWNVTGYTESDILIPNLNEEKNDSLTTTSPTTEAYTIQTENTTTIGYNIVEETTEIYTLKENPDNDYYTINVTTPEPTTNELEATAPVVTLTTIAPAHSTETTLTTEIFANESSKDSTVPKMGENTTTEMPNVHPSDTTIHKDNAPYNTTMRPEMNFTETVDSKVETDSILPEIDLNGNSTIFTTPEVMSNETENFETTTTDFSVTTIASIPPVIPQSNRTSEVRSYDDDVQNYTTTTSSYSDTTFSSDGIIPEASTEINTYAENSSTTELNTDDLLTTSLFTTTLPTVESTPKVILNVTASDESDSATTTVNGNITEHESITSTERTIVETTTFNDFSEMDSETEVNTEPTVPEFTTQNPHSFDMSHNTNETSEVTTSVNENGTTTIQPTEAEYNNATVGLTGIIEAVLNESLAVQNSTEMNTTPASFGTSENETTIAPNSTEINEILPNVGETTTILYHETTMNLYNETATSLGSETTENLETTTNVYNETAQNLSNETIKEHFKTTTSYAENDTTAVPENYTTVEDSTLPLELNGTENSLLFPTSEPLNLSINETIPTVAPIDENLNKSIIDTDKTNENETLVNTTNPTFLNNSEETYTITTAEDFSFPTPPTYTNESGENTTVEPNYGAELVTTLEYNNSTLYSYDTSYDSNFTQTMPYGSSSEEMNSTLLPSTYESTENATFSGDFGNFTTDGYESTTNETTTNASTGIECREDQFLCEPLNKCINDTFMCDGIEDCPDGQDEFECKDTCHSNFMCANSSTCIMSDARCDGIWDCENGTDEENCTPTECAKHEVMCLDGSKCIKPGHICDWKYNCLDRSDEVGCVERTTCESGGRFFCNDGLCIPWSLKCDGEHDCKEGEDEGNCTCLNDEFQCNDGKCLKSSSRCDGHQDCHNAEDEMGCVNVDSEHIVSTYEPYSGTWGLLCAEDWNLDDGQYLCQELGFGHALNVERIHVSFNGTWMAMRRDNLTESSLWTERVSFVESCTSGLAAAVECQKFACGEYTGLLHRRRRDVVSSSSNQWPFIGYTSTFHSNKGCLSEILTPIWLITSAECLLSISKEPFNGSDWYVRTSIGRNVEVDVAQNHEVLRIITHPHSSKFRSLTLRDYDVALIRLKHALVFVSDKIGAICPPDEQVPPGITCFSGVLGTEKPRAPPPEVLTINSLALQILDRRNCNRVEHFNNTINHRMLCTQSSEGHTICDNDEGTPLMCLTGINKWFLAGMLTYQRFCDVYSKHPAVFSNLFSMRKYLDQVTGQKQYEIPYDNSVYTIIPPTTPSPTLPETTTTEMTTEITTEAIFIEPIYLTTSEYQNTTESALGEVNGTTVAYEELAREENDSAVLHSDFVTDLTNVTLDEMPYNNETTTIPYGTDYDVINTTVKELEESKDELLANRTHSHLTSSILNDTYGYDFNATDMRTTNDSTEFNNATFYLSETTIPMDVTGVTTTTDLNYFDTIKYLTPSEVDITTATSTDIIETLMNETEKTVMDTTTTDNVTISPSLDDSIDISNFTLSNFTEVTTNISLVSAVNDSSETFRSMKATNESRPINRSLVTFINDTSEIEERGNLSETITTTEIPLIGVFNESLELMPELTKDNMSLSQPLVPLTNDSNFSEVTTTDMPLSNLFNESFEMLKPGVPPTNKNMSISQPLISLFNNETEIENYSDITTTEMPLINIFNESLEMFKPRIASTNANMSVNHETMKHLINETTASEKGNFSEVTTTAMPLINIFNESLEIFRPITVLTNENISISQPQTTLMNITTTTDKGVLETLQNNTGSINTESGLLETSTNTDDEVTTINTPATTILPTKAETDLETTPSTLSDVTETFTLEIAGEPDADLAFSIFKDSDKLKFERLLENSDMNSTFKEHTTTTIGNEDNTNITTSLPFVNETSLPPVTTTTSPIYVSNITEVNVLELDNVTMETNLELERTDYTTPVTIKTINTTLEDEHYENITSMPELITVNGTVEDPIIKMHLVSEKLTVLLDNSTSHNITQCGLWDGNFTTLQNDSDNFFMKWPALGYLQMTSEIKICPSAVISDKFVITSLHCLTSRDEDLDPNKWTYTGGSYQPNITTHRIQNHGVKEIIPYPDQTTSIFLKEHDIVLVRVKGTITNNLYSKSVCLPQDEAMAGKECFITGWSKNDSGEDLQKQFHSTSLSIIPTNECNKTMSGLLIDDLICGSHNETSHVCRMDFGTPLFCLNENKHWEIHGILNFPGPCDIAQPAVFSSIISVQKWITDSLINDKVLN